MIATNEEMRRMDQRMAEEVHVSVRPLITGETDSPWLFCLRICSFLLSSVPPMENVPRQRLIMRNSCSGREQIFMI